MNTTEQLPVRDLHATRSVSYRPNVVAPDTSGRHYQKSKSARFQLVRRLLHSFAETGRPPQRQQRLELLVGPNGASIWIDSTQSALIQCADQRSGLR